MLAHAYALVNSPQIKYAILRSRVAYLMVCILPFALGMSQPTAAHDTVAAPHPQPNRSLLSFWHPGSFVALVRGRGVLLAVLLLTISFFALTAVVLQAN